MDADRDGTLTLEEMLQSPEYQPSNGEHRPEEFAIFDSDTDEQISLAEYQTTYRACQKQRFMQSYPGLPPALYQYSMITAPAPEPFFWQMDEDGNNLVNRTEYQNYPANKLNRISERAPRS